MQVFSSESVFPGHPDKVVDQISDAILDSVLRSNGESCGIVVCYFAAYDNQSSGDERLDCNPRLRVLGHLKLP